MCLSQTLLAEGSGVFFAFVQPQSIVAALLAQGQKHLNGIWLAAMLAPVCVQIVFGALSKDSLPGMVPGRVHMLTSASQL